MHLARVVMTGILCGLCLDTAWAETRDVAPHFDRRVETQLRVGNDRTLNITEIWQPFASDVDRVNYLSLRTAVDNQESFEGNIGLGRRAFYGDHIWGGYGFLDRRHTAFGSEFWQVNAGLEYYRPSWEARVNVYVPFNRTRTYTGPVSGPVVAGNNIILMGPSTVIEEAQPGLDAEMGFVLPDIEPVVGHLRAYTGVYHFEGDQTDDMTGVRARLVGDVAPWLQVGARVQYDDVRGTQSFAELTVRWPGRASVAPRDVDHPRLWARMADSPERDVDVVTGSSTTEGPAMTMTDRLTGQAARFLYVDNTATPGGDGTAERPFATLADALSHMQAHDTIYVATGDGTSNGYDGAVNLVTNGVTLHGAGSALMLDGTRYGAGTFTWDGNLVIRDAGLAPWLTNNSGDVVTIAAHDITVRGLMMDGANGSGVVIRDGADQVRLENLWITGNAGNGVTIANHTVDPMRVTMRETVITGNLLYGLQVDQNHSGAVAFDLGTADDPGFNHIFGNTESVDVYVNRTGLITNATGNYWGDTPLIGGPGGGSVPVSLALTTPLCTLCVAGMDQGFDAITQGVSGTPAQSNTVTLGLMRGSRFLKLVSPVQFGVGDGAPQWILNGTPTASPYVRVRAGDTVAAQVTPHPVSWYSRFVTISGAGLNHTWQVQTQ